jgi:uncharacterized protein YcgL (UPF0745 family)
MRCFVYKSLKKPDTYLYLGQRDDFARLPPPVRSRLGELGFVIEFDLTPERQLAREDPAVVRENLSKHGFHVQFPPPPSLADTPTHDDR